MDLSEKMISNEIEKETQDYSAQVRSLLSSSFHLRLNNVQLVGNRPVKHDGQPEDIASIVSYLASKEAHFITGERLCCGTLGVAESIRRYRTMRKNVVY